jgi:tetratricopeptide (TPR) repeat protein/N-acetylneuraminic acid mutarotase
VSGPALRPGPQAPEDRGAARAPAVTSGTPKARWVALALLSLVGLGVFAPTLRYPFVYDDDAFVVLNESIRSLKNLPFFFTDTRTLAFDQQLAHDNYRPLVTLSFAVNYALHGLDPLGYRALNLLLHITNGWLLFMLGLRLFSPRQAREAATPGSSPELRANLAAFISAAVFLVHPVQVESVVFISSRSNVLSLAFFLTSLLVYLKREKSGSLSLALFGMGLLTKEMVIVLPAILVLWELYFGRSTADRSGVMSRAAQAVGKALPYFILAGLYFGLRTYMLGRTGQSGYWAGSFWPTMLTMSRGIAAYVKLMLVPYPLSLEYLFTVSRSVFEPKVLGSLLFLAGILFAAFRCRAVKPVLSFGIIFFFVGLLPVSNIIPIKAVIQERFMYLSVIGFSLVAGDLALMLSGQRSWVIWPLMLMVYGTLTAFRSQDWRSGMALVKATLKTCPQSARMHYGLGRQYAAEGDFDKAAAEFKIALSIDPQYDEATRDLGRIALQEGDTETAIQNYRKTLQTKVNMGDALFNMGTAYLKAGKYAEAIQAFEQAMGGNIKDANSEMVSNLAAAYAYAGKIDKAINVCVELLEANPGLIKTRYNLALYYRAVGLPEAAKEQLQKALAVKPDWDMARRELEELTREIAARPPPEAPKPEPAPVAEAGEPLPEFEPEVVRFIQEKFPAMEPKLARGARTEFEPSTLKAPGGAVQGVRPMEGYLGAAQSYHALKPEERAALEALARRDGRAAEQNAPRFFFPKTFGTIGIEFQKDYQIYVTAASPHARKAPGRVEQGALVYRDAYPSADVLYVLRPGEMEKLYLLREKRPEHADGFLYRLEGNANVSEFRVADGLLQVVSKKTGSPVLELTPPVVFDSAGKKVPARYEVQKEGERKWLLTVRFSDEGLQYPLLIDPTWRTAGAGEMPIGGRLDHTATLLPNGKVLVAGGQDTNTLAMSTAVLYDPSAGTWATTGSMSTARFNHTATLLGNGKVLVAGGTDENVDFSTAELYDPSGGTWSTTGSMASARDMHSATRLPNGKVLVAGGGSSIAELYDPSAGTWSATGAMSSGRGAHTATLLSDGSVLAAGGDSGATVFSTAEIYNPSVGTWSTTNSLLSARRLHSATVLPNGKVLVAGGRQGATSLSTAELYDPSAGTWAVTGALASNRHYHMTVLLPNGKVLVGGGYLESSEITELSTAELYDAGAGTWSTIGSMSSARTHATATLLANGKVLAAGGAGTAFILSSAELYDPSIGNWNANNAMSTARQYHSATLLPNGKVLVAGGQNASTDLSTAELYDPSAGTWSSTGSMLSGRSSHTATLLPNGKVLAAGGYLGARLSTAEIYDPSAGTWAATGSLSTARYQHTATLLSNGKVLVAGGGQQASNPYNFSTAELYDPAAGTWSATGSMASGRRSHTATPLNNGKILVAGGQSDSDLYISTAELYDPAAGTWSTTNAMPRIRGYHTATLLSNGKVLAAGGYTSGSLAAADLYDPAAGTWAATGSMASTRDSHPAVLLPSGRVLVMGGYNTSTAEIYDPAAGSWFSATSLTAERYGPTATLLPSGNILVVGGNDPSPSNTYLSSAETALYTEHDYAAVTPSIQPRIDKVNGSGSFPANIFPGTKVTLQGARFMGVSEGSGGNYGPMNSPANLPRVYIRSHDTGNIIDLSTSVYSYSISSTSISFDLPSSFSYGYYSLWVQCNAVPSTFTVVNVVQDTSLNPSAPSSSSNSSVWRTAGAGSISSARYFHSATLLPNGKVLITGGTNNTTTFSTASLYDPAAGTWSTTNSMLSARQLHAATLLPSGKVLVSGGWDGGSNTHSTCELYDPEAGTWSSTGSMLSTRDLHSATLLNTGKVLVAGGEDVNGNRRSTAELYDPSAGTWSAAGAMSTARRSFAATLLANEKVLITGGYSATASLSTCEVYDPAGAGSWSTTGTMATARRVLSATLLPSGKVLAAGGYNGTNAMSTAELYDPAAGTWSTTGSMASARYQQTATLLPSGKVLVTAGDNENVSALSTTELYDPTAGTWSTAGTLASARYQHTATLLPSGKVLVVAGDGATARLSTAELYDPALGAWSAANVMSTARYQHSATLLPSGYVLVAGGHTGSGRLSTAQLYDPSMGTWSTTGSLATARYGHLALLLPTGRVLAAGGQDSADVLTAELYDPVAGTWSATGSLTSARVDSTATLLPNGKVLVAGGMSGVAGLVTAEVYDPVAGTWTTTNSLASGRYSPAATLLPNGKVLVTGGVNTGTFLSTAELYDPSAGSWSTTNPMASSRYSHTATLLPSGKVLVAGGNNGSVNLSTAEVYDPVAGTWSASGSLATARRLHAATLLPSGKVLFTGGVTGLSTVELYDPSAGTWATANSLLTGRNLHTATLLANGKTILIGGETLGGARLSTAELAYYSSDQPDSAWQPVVTGFPRDVDRGQTVTVSGTRFKGVSGASGGYHPSSSPTNYPRVYLQRADSGNSEPETGSKRLVDLSTYVYANAGNSWSSMDTSLTFTLPSSSEALPYGWYHLRVMANAIVSDSSLVRVANLTTGGSPFVRSTSHPETSYSSNTFVTWTATGINAGGHYHYLFNQVGSSSPAAGDAQWDGSSLQLQATAEGAWYMHVSGKNASHGGGETQDGYSDFGPIYIDTSPPVAIQDVSARASTSAASVTVLWTSPDDRRAGTVPFRGYYRLQYSPAPNPPWNAAQYNARFSAGVYESGTALSYTVDGLEYGTTYYFAVFSEDLAGNISAVSNAASALTPTGFKSLPLSRGSADTTSDCLGDVTSRNSGSPLSDITAAACSDAVYTVLDNAVVAFSSHATTGVPDEPIQSQKIAGRYRTNSTACSNSIQISTNSGGTWHNKYQLVTSTTDASFTVDVSTILTTRNQLSSTWIRYTNCTGGNAANNRKQFDYLWIEGISAASAPATVSNLTASNPSSTTVTLTWTSPGDDGNSNTITNGYFRIKASTDTNHVYDLADYTAQIATTASAGSSQSYSLAGLTPNSSHYIRLWTGDEVPNWSSASNSTTTLTLAAKPGTPANPFTGVFQTSVTVSWLANGNPSNTEYFVQASTASDFTGTLFYPAGGAVWLTGTSTTVVSLSASTTYYFQVKARNLANTETAFEVLGSTQTGAAALAVPANRSVLNVYVSSITARWDLVSGATGYTLAASTNSANPPEPVWVSSTTVGNSETTATVSGLDPNTTFYLFVRANGPGASSPYGAYSGTSTLANAVTNTQVYAAYTTSVTVNWTALPASPSSSTAEGYLLQASTASNFTGTIYSSQTASVSLSTLTVSGLAGDTTYYFRVGSLNWNSVPNYAASVSTRTIGILSISISTGLYSYGSVIMSSAVVSTETIVVTNNGDIPTTWSVRASTISPSLWNLTTGSPAQDLFRMRAAFHNVQPSTSAFQAEDILAVTDASSSGTIFSIDGTQTGQSVPAGGTRNLWFLMETPPITSTVEEQKVSVTITANE